MDGSRGRSERKMDGTGMDDVVDGGKPYMVYNYIRINSDSN